MDSTQAAALRRVERAIARRGQARTDAEAAIVEARAAGCTLKAIAAAAHVTHPQVINILRKHQADE